MRKTVKKGAAAAHATKRSKKTGAAARRAKPSKATRERDKVSRTLSDMQGFIAGVRSASASGVPYKFTRQDTGLEKRVRSLVEAAKKL